MSRNISSASREASFELSHGTRNLERTMVKMKMKKLACAFAAAAMMFTSAPVFAADNSPVPGDVITYPTEANVPTASTTYEHDGQKVEIVKEELNAEDAKDVDTPEKVVDLIEGAGFTLPANSTVVVTGGEYFAEVNDQEVDVNGQIPMIFDLAGKDYAAGQSVFVLHKMHNGEWEVIQATVDANYQVAVSLNGLSPVVIAKVMTDGTVKPVEPSTTPDKPVTPSTDKNEPTKTSTTTETVKTSPSTAC